MTKFTSVFLILTFTISCAGNRTKFNYETSIASSVYEAQLKYLDNTLFNYSRISEKGSYFWKEDSSLEIKTQLFKARISYNSKISDSEKMAFFNHFEKILLDHGLTDMTMFDKIKTLPIRTVSDVDLLRLFIKNNFVSILLNNKLLPFDIWGTMATSNCWTIGAGEEFQVELATTASSSIQPNEWYLVKPNSGALTKDNIIDTLHPDKFGVVNFKTKEYKKGKNRLVFISKLNTPPHDRAVSREVIFMVK